MFMLELYHTSLKNISLNDVIFKSPTPRLNQIETLTSLFNNRIMINDTYDVPKTGICCGATGCGKTYIALNLIKMIGMLNNYDNGITILWFTERKSILTDLFLKYDNNMYIPDTKKYRKIQKMET